MNYILRVSKSKRFIKDYERAKKRGFDLSLLDEAIKILATGKQLPPQYKDHKLIGAYKGYRDCHIKNDWVLIYRIDNDILELFLLATGTHSDVFGK